MQKAHSPASETVLGSSVLVKDIDFQPKRKSWQAKQFEREKEIWSHRPTIPTGEKIPRIDVIRQPIINALNLSRSRFPVRVGVAITAAERAEHAMASVRAASAKGPALGYGAYLTAHSAGRLCALKMPPSRDTKPAGGGKRGRVNHFSAASRNRMLKLIHRVKRSVALPVFVTLTFPDLFPEFSTAKKTLDTLFKRWKRRWPRVSAIWRIEAKARRSGSMAGNVAPHFHLLVWGAGFDSEKARQDWFEICGNSDYAHWKHGYNDAGKEMASWEQAAHYCAEYCAKKGNVDAPGRQWGVHNRDAMPVDNSPVIVRLSLAEAFKVRRILRGAVERKCGRRVRAAQSVFTSDPECFLRLVAMLRGVNTRRMPQQPTRAQHWRAALRK